MRRDGAAGHGGADREESWAVPRGQSRKALDRRAAGATEA